MKAIFGFLVTSTIIIFSVAVSAQTQSELNGAASKEFAAADEQLRVVYQKLFNALDPAGQGKLANAREAGQILQPVDVLCDRG
jgi:hypothetical protein